MFDFRCMCITLLIGATFFLTDVNGIEKRSKSSAAQPNENNAHKYLQKRQISAQLSPFIQQDFPSPFIYDQSNGNTPTRQFPSQATFDEEERFFLEQQETTLNPLAFINPPRNVTPSPAEQQAIDVQRRFQEEIANKGLREQEQRSLGLAQPPTTPSTTTTTTTQNSFDPYSFQINPFDSTEPETDFKQSTDDFFLRDGRVSQSPLAESVQPQLPLPQSDLPQSHFPQSVLSQEPQSHSYAYSRIYRSLNRKSRSIGQKNLSVNRLPSTDTSQRFHYSEKRQAVPRSEHGSIGNWLITLFSQQLQQNIANLAQFTSSPPKAFKSAYSNPQIYNKPSYTERPSIYSTPTYHSTASHLWQHQPEASLGLTTSRTWQGHAIPSTEFPITSSQPFQYTGTGSSESSPSWNTPLRFQIQQFPQTETEPSPKNEITNYVPTVQTTSIPQAPRFKHLPDAYMIQPHVTLIPHSAPTYSPFPESSNFASTNDNGKSSGVKNIQILTSSPVPLQFDNLSVRQQKDEEEACRQIFGAEHQTSCSTATPEQSSSTLESEVENTSVTNLVRSKLKQFKSSYPNQVAALEETQSKFQQPNQFLDQLQQQPNTDSSSYENANSANAADVPADLASGNYSKAAIFIRVPTEEPTSTVGYVFNKGISAKTLQKKDYRSAHKKNYRSAQVIKSSLVYRTPPGKRATLSREEQIQNNRIAALKDGTPIKWLLGNAVQTSTHRPLLNALLNIIQ